MKIVKTFRYLRDTTNTKLYKEVDEEDSRTRASYYLSKSDAAKLGDPGSLVITIEAGD